MTTAYSATPLAQKLSLKDGMRVWFMDMPDSVRVSWPKKSAKVATDITEDAIRDIALLIGFVDIKVCAVDAIWSGLKLVIRKDLR